MKRLTSSSLAALIAPLLCPLSLVACDPPTDISEATLSSGEANNQTRSFALTGFNAVSLDGPDELHVVQGASFMVTARGSEKLLNRLALSVKGGTLVVSRKDPTMAEANGTRAVVTVVMPLIRAVSLYGSGPMAVDGTADDRFKALLGGSGNLTIAGIRALQSEFTLGGSGKMKLSGGTQQGAFKLSGSGDVDAERLEHSRLSISASGSGSINAMSNGKAEISASGSGNVLVSGTSECTITRTGSGKARCVQPAPEEEKIEELEPTSAAEDVISNSSQPQ